MTVASGAPACKLLQQAHEIASWSCLRREGCLCVICKQARKTGRAWAGMTADGTGARAPGFGQSGAFPPPLPGRRGSAGPPPRLGKRAFLHALAHMPAGPRRTSVSMALALMAPLQ